MFATERRGQFRRRVSPKAARWAAVVLCALVLTSFSVGAKESSEAEVDRVQLAAKMLSDGHLDRAQQLLDEVDAEAKGVDRQKLFTLRGVVSLQRDQFADAADNFERAVAEGPVEPAVFRYLAQAHFRADHFEQCLTALGKAGKSGEVREGYLMAAQSHWELKRPGRALEVLGGAIEKLPKEASLQRMRIFFLVELGLYQRVVELSHSYLARTEASEEEYLALGEALRAGGQIKQAQVLLEEAKLRFPKSEKVSLQLAHSYLDDSKPASAGQIFEEAAQSNPKYFLEAAETYKQAGRLARAFRNNARIVDQKEKLKQRLSLLLAQERFEEIGAMTSALSRFNLLADENIRYALAFAYFNTGQLPEAESQLQGIVDPGLFESAVQLRKAIERCRDAGWQCQQ